MAITDPQGRLLAYYEQCVKILADSLTENLSYLGEKCVRRIKDRGPGESWVDHTSNLRSSIAYAVYNQGVEAVRSTLSGAGAQGITEGNKMLDDLAAKYADTFALVVIAGMEYASLVEDIDSKDVLASTRLWAEGEVKRYIDSAMEKAEKRMAKLNI